MPKWNEKRIRVPRNKLPQMPVKRETRNTKHETRNAKRLTRDTNTTNAEVRRETQYQFNWLSTTQLWYEILRYAQRETNCNKCQSETRNATFTPKRETRNGKRNRPFNERHYATNVKVRREVHNSSIVKYAHRETNCNKCQSETRNANAKRETRNATRATRNIGTKCQSGTRNALRATRNKLQHETTTIITKQHHRFHGKASAHQTTPCAIALRRRKNPCSRHHLEHVEKVDSWQLELLFS